MVKISLCMIMKNEEKYLPACLKSVQGAVDEIVIADTGSSDASVQIAESFGAQVEFFPWIDDFSAARNFALSRCTGDWILYLDADEVLSPESVPVLRSITSGSSVDALYCSLFSIDDVGGRPNTMHYLRLFRNNSRIRFTGRVHEQIDHSVREGNFRTASSAIRIIHYGYNISTEALRIKAERNLTLLKKQYSELQDSYSAFQIAQSFGIIGNIPQALEYFHLALNDSSLHPAYTAHSYRFLAAAELEQGATIQAAEYIQKAFATGEKQPLLFVIAAKIGYAVGEPDKGRECMINAISFNHKLLSGEIKPFFDIMSEPTELALYAMELAVNSGDKLLFEHAYAELSSMETARSQREFLHALFQGIAPEEKKQKEFFAAIKENHLSPLLGLIKNFLSSEEAVKILLNVVQFFPLAPVYHSLAELSAKLHDYSSAEQHYTQARTLAPTHPGYMFAYILFLAEQNKFLQAYKELCSFKDFQILPVHTQQKITILKNKLAHLVSSQ